MNYYDQIRAHNAGIDLLPVLMNETEAGPSALLQLALLGEYQQWDLYTAYASRLKGEARGPVADEFKAHAEEELGHIELIQRHLVSMGENPSVSRKPLPAMPPEAANQDFIRLQLQFEKDAVSLYERILDVLPENEALKLDIETVLTKEQEHVHDLELLLGPSSATASAKAAAGELLEGYHADKEAKAASKRKGAQAQSFRPQEPGEATRPQAGYSLPFLAKVGTEWCAKAMKELTPDIYARWNQGKLLTAMEKSIVIQAIDLKHDACDKRAMIRFLDSGKS
jgi:bacterioferritin (cytochrome b1)